MFMTMDLKAVTQISTDLDILLVETKMFGVMVTQWICWR